jgi:hypothetical protein
MNFTDRIAEFINGLVFDFVEAIIDLITSISDALASAFS